MDLTKGLIGAAVALGILGAAFSVIFWFKFCFELSEGEPWGLALALGLPFVIIFFLIGALN